MTTKRQSKGAVPFHWIIKGYEGSKKIYERKGIKAGSFGEHQMEALLMALAAKSLTFEEILGAYAKKNSKLRNELLEVHRETTRYLFWCGQHQYFTAEIEEHKRKKWPPKLPTK